MDDFVAFLSESSQSAVFDLNRISAEDGSAIASKLGIHPDEVLKRVLKPPYAEAVDNLRKLKIEHSPIDKMRVFAKSCKLIVTCNNEFWEGVTYIPRQKLDSKLAIDVEQLVNIFKFIIVHAGLPDLFSQLKLASQYMTPNLKLTKLGQIATTIEGGLDQILDLHEDDLQPVGHPVDQEQSKSSGLCAGSAQVDFSLESTAMDASTEPSSSVAGDTAKLGSELTPSVA